MLTRDILYISLSVAALVATIFWVWLLWYIIKIFKSIESLVEDFRARLATIDTILHTIQDKLTSTHVQLSMLVEGVKQALNFINARREKKRSKSSSRASTDADDV